MVLCLPPPSLWVKEKPPFCAVRLEASMNGFLSFRFWYFFRYVAWIPLSHQKWASPFSSSFFGPADPHVQIFFSNMARLHPLLLSSEMPPPLLPSVPLMSDGGFKAIGMMHEFELGPRGLGPSRPPHRHIFFPVGGPCSSESQPPGPISVGFFSLSEFSAQRGFFCGPSRVAMRNPSNP